MYLLSFWWFSVWMENFSIFLTHLLNIVSSSWNFYCPPFTLKECEVQKVKWFAYAWEIATSSTPKLLHSLSLKGSGSCLKYYYREMRHISSTTHLNQYHPLVIKPHVWRILVSSVDTVYEPLTPWIWSHMNSLTPAVSNPVTSKAVSHQFR